LALEILGVNTFDFILSLSSLIVAFAFMIGSASAQFFEVRVTVACRLAQSHVVSHHFSFSGDPTDIGEKALRHWRPRCHFQCRTRYQSRWGKSSLPVRSLAPRTKIPSHFVLTPFWTVVIVGRRKDRRVYNNNAHGWDPRSGNRSEWVIGTFAYRQCNQI